MSELTPVSDGIRIAREYAPFTWYWKAEDGRVYSSKRELIVDETDTDYLAFLEGGPATEWPRDAGGNQTDAALQEVVEPYGKTVGIAAFAAKYRDMVEREGFTADGVEYAYDELTFRMITIAVLAGDDTHLIAKDGSVNALSRSQLESVVQAMHAMVDKYVQRYGKALSAKTRQEVIDIFRAP
ncbi:hypothetical protein KIP88_02675 [Bradyrhizobium sp. SRL28]|uniref:DUF4376 domain-containing protein n=1 Tax=Bradyrhizobium sp. SRL28 TaxID=2836178 RepID=UPI001BDE269C|nr:DUF4376 domain-containing protein [Bradyrhizobium sp. SRL28]MBT1509395.1 hypothetical protein [Bradyrhizobium sp. SRL28]